MLIEERWLPLGFARRSDAALSGGQHQVQALARALCGKPRLLLLDEPTEGVQPSIVDEIEGHLACLAASGLGIVVVEQDLEFIGNIAHRVLILQKGQVVREIAPQALRDPALIDEFMGIRP